MHRFLIFYLISFAITSCCMGQMFQYSRGWTNGQRASLNLQDPAVFEVPEMPETERRLEKCIIQLQRLIHNSYLPRPLYAANGNGIPNGESNRHQSTKKFEELTASAESSAKHN